MNALLLILALTATPCPKVTPNVTSTTVTADKLNCLTSASLDRHREETVAALFQKTIDAALMGDSHIVWTGSSYLSLEEAAERLTARGFFFENIYDTELDGRTLAKDFAGNLMVGGFTIYWTPKFTGQKPGLNNHP